MTCSGYECCGDCALCAVSLCDCGAVATQGELCEDCAFVEREARRDVALWLAEDEFEVVEYELVSCDDYQIDSDGACYDLPGDDE